MYCRQKKDKVTFVESKSSMAKINFLIEEIQIPIKPILKINKKIVYNMLLTNGIMNAKKKPCCKVNIINNSNYNIVLYFRKVMNKLLSYYRCADDFYKIKNIVNWFVRYSAISTVKHKHKLASRKTVVDKYKIDLACLNHKGNTIKLITKNDVNELKKKFIININFNWKNNIKKS